MEPTPLGHFNRLPLEIREAIWANLLPAGENGWWRKPHKTGLAILRASHTLYDEITAVFHSHPQLVFHLTPSPWEWMTISYTAEHHVLPRQTSPENKWSIRDAEDLRARGFYSLPFDRVDLIGVAVGAPDPDSPRDLFVLFSKVMSLVDVLRGASTIREIDVEFQQYGRQDWHHCWVTDDGEEEERSYPVPSDNCNMMAVPFYSLRNLEQIQFR